MLYVKTEVRQSPVEGKGLFLLEPVKKGTILANFGHHALVMTEEEYLHELRQHNELILKSGVRWVGKYFLYNPAIGPEEYLNHSNDPTILYHCGVCFARRDLQPGEELTADYRFFLSARDEAPFEDIFSHQMINGITAKEALLQSAQELIELLQGIEKL